MESWSARSGPLPCRRVAERAVVVLHRLDARTRALVRAAAAIAGLDEPAMRAALAEARRADLPAEWMDELILQSTLFCGFPRALNAAREWRRLAPLPASAAAHPASLPDAAAWRAQGEVTCAAVYDGMYGRLRENIAALHPALDDWMIVDGYGKVLSRPALDLPRRELCIVAACATTAQDRQLHSHLHGALNVGVSRAALDDTIEALADLVPESQHRSVRLLLDRVAGK